MEGLPEQLELGRHHLAAVPRHCIAIARGAQDAAVAEGAQAGVHRLLGAEVEPPAARDLAFIARSTASSRFICAPTPRAG
jgi:hypothetical protein